MTLFDALTANASTYIGGGCFVSSVGGWHGHGHIVLGLSWIGQLLLIAGTSTTPTVVPPSLLVTACRQVIIIRMITE